MNSDVPPDIKSSQNIGYKLLIKMQKQMNVNFVLQ